MNEKLNDLLQISTIQNNNCENCKDIFFLPSTDEAKNSNIKAKTKIEELLRSADLNIINRMYFLSATGATNVSSIVNLQLAVRPMIRLNMPIKNGKDLTIGDHKFVVSENIQNCKTGKRLIKHFIAIEDLAVPKEFDVEYFRGYNKEMDFQTLYSKPVSEFKPAKFEILNFDTMQKDGHILAILDQPLTCLHYGENNKYTESFVRQQLALLPNLMFEKALEMQAEAENLADEKTKFGLFTDLKYVLADIEKRPAESFSPKSESMQKISQEYAEILNAAYTDAFEKCQTKKEIEKLDRLADAYTDKFTLLVNIKRIELQNSQELAEAKINSQKQAENRIKSILSIGTEDTFSK